MLINITSSVPRIFIIAFIFHVLLISGYSQDTIPVSNQQTVNLYRPLPPSFSSKNFVDSSTVKKNRVWLVAGGQAALWVGSFAALNQFWYADYPKSSFHFFNDIKEWNQMDKAGHIFSTFAISNVSSKMWQWSGLSHKKSSIYGAIGSIAYQSIIEIQDGFSEEWGFSVPDMAANFVGAGIFLAQELAWKEKRIRLKLSFLRYDYADDIEPRADELFGSSFIERYLKDYNSQTYWVSVNPSSFMKESNFPVWLNIAAGYSSEVMLGGTENTWTDKQGVYYDRSDIPRIRRFYIAPDIDLTRIPTRSKFLRTAFQLMAGIKFPAPTLELNSKGKFKAHWLYF